MKKTYVITEGDSDRLLLEILLEVSPDRPDVQVVAAGGWSSADSLARSVLATSEHRAAIVVDADTIDSVQADYRRRFLHHSLGEAGLPSRWRVVVIVPEIEVLLFKDPHLLQQMTGGQVDPTDLVRGLYEPRKILEKWFPRKKWNEIYLKLREFDLSTLRDLPELIELRNFIEAVSPQEAAA